jgi:hypothetical protein
MYFELRFCTALMATATFMSKKSETSSRTGLIFNPGRPRISLKTATLPLENDPETLPERAPKSSQNGPETLPATTPVLHPKRPSLFKQNGARRGGIKSLETTLNV